MYNIDVEFISMDNRGITILEENLTTVFSSGIIKENGRIIKKFSKKSDADHTPYIYIQVRDNLDAVLTGYSYHTEHYFHGSYSGFRTVSVPQYINVPHKDEEFTVLINNPFYDKKIKEIGDNQFLSGESLLSFLLNFHHDQEDPFLDQFLSTNISLEEIKHIASEGFNAVKDVDSLKKLLTTKKGHRKKIEGVPENTIHLYVEKFINFLLPKFEEKIKKAEEARNKIWDKFGKKLEGKGTVETFQKNFCSDTISPPPNTIPLPPPEQESKTFLRFLKVLKVLLASLVGLFVGLSVISAIGIVVGCAVGFSVGPAAGLLAGLSAGLAAGFLGCSVGVFEFLLLHCINNSRSRNVTLKIQAPIANSEKKDKKPKSPDSNLIKKGMGSALLPPALNYVRKEASQDDRKEEKDIMGMSSFTTYKKAKGPPSITDLSIFPLKQNSTKEDGQNKEDQILPPHTTVHHIV